MTVRTHSHAHAHEPLHMWQKISVRTGTYLGITLSVLFGGWVVVANRVSSLDRFALARNLAAVAVLAVVGLIPILRFWREPGNLLASSLVSWLLFSVSYRVLSIYFGGLEVRFSAFQVFVLGAVPYMLVVTLAWIWAIIRRARAESHPDHPPS